MNEQHVDPAELLLELRTEPVVGIRRLNSARDFERTLIETFRDQGLLIRKSELMVTPFRVALVLELDVGENLVSRVEEVLQPVLESSVYRLGAGSSPYLPAPLNGLLVLLDGEALPVKVNGIKASPHSIGHVLSSTRQFKVGSVAEYRRELASRGIEARPAEREARLLLRLEEKANDLGGQCVEDDGLLSDLTQGLEVAGVLACQLPELALELPREFVHVCLRDKQRGFAIEKAHRLVPWFLVTMDRLDDPKGAVRSGHERSLLGRLRAIEQMWREDRLVPMAERYRELGSHAGDLAGTSRDRADRLSILAEALCRDAGWDGDSGMAAEAAKLLKADASARLCLEFPSLAGVLSGLLAQAEGYPESLWQAIYDQARPRYAGDSIPRGRVGKIVALADRLDELVTRCAGGEPATGPFAVRSRAVATGIIRIILQGRVQLDLDLAAARAVRGFRGALSRSDEQILADMRPVFDWALRSVLAQDGYRPDEVEAVLGASGGRYLPDVLTRIQVVNRLQDDGGFARLVRSAHRLVEILADSPEFDIDPDRLIESAERALFAIWGSLREEVDEALREGRAERWLLRMGELNEALERFFAEVLVRDENESLRQNRLALLQAVHRVFSRQVRLAEIESVARANANDG